MTKAKSDNKTEERYKYLAAYYLNNDEKPVYNELTAVDDKSALELALRDVPAGTKVAQVYLVNTVAFLELPSRRSFPKSVHHE